MATGHIGVRAGRGGGGGGQKKFGASREIWAKPAFKDVFNLFFAEEKEFPIFT